jgi:DNA-binding NarL/FixJ family response regulator
MPISRNANDAEGGVDSRLAAELATLIREAEEDMIVVVGQGDLDVSVYGDLDALPALDGSPEPALILLSARSPVASQLGAIEQLLRRFVGTPLLIACIRIERWEVRAALGAGAAGVVLVGDVASTLDPCIRAVRSGQTCVPRPHSGQIEPPALSAREKQILGLVVMGYMNGQIAEKLVLAESTVKSHLSSAFGKLGVRSRNEAVDLILNPERGLGMGILTLGASPVDPPHALN